jgi:hypothetical protein
MKIGRFWRRSQIHTNAPDGRPIEVAAWGWSADDPAEAQRQAEERSQRSAKRIAAGEPFPNTYEGYEQASVGYSTCVFVEQFGNDRTVAIFRGLIEIHDRDTRSESSLPLA